MRSGHHATGRRFGRQHRAERKPSADPLGHHHDVGRDPGPFMGEQPPRTAHTALHLVKDHQRPGCVTEIAEPLEAGVGQGADAAFALDRLQHHGGRGGGDRRPQRVMVAEWQVGEAGQQRAEALDHLFPARGRNRPGRAAVERPGKGHDLDPLGLALFRPVLPRHLDRQFGGFGAGIGEKHRVGKGFGDQPVGQRLLVGDLIEVRRMPQQLRLVGQRRHQRRVGMAKDVDGNPAAEIQKAPALGIDQPRAFAFDKGQRGTVIGGQNGSDHGEFLRGSTMGAKVGRKGQWKTGSGWQPRQIAALRSGASASGH